ncbi:NACHT, LRR and PYD domains-containing protein 3 [Musca autumnalis]|uniref:NACHT, LRR and PYD domains-containing protein 3 n=1 Tax=Musca autumnalis TaxID=221902 RepID=UPI003CF3F67C
MSLTAVLLCCEEETKCLLFVTLTTCSLFVAKPTASFPSCIPIFQKTNQFEEKSLPGKCFESVPFMDFTYNEFPISVELNTLKTYFDLKQCKLPKSVAKTFNVNYDDGDGVSDVYQPKSLRHLVLDFFLENWCDNPIYTDIPEQKDRNYLLSNLDVNLPLKILSLHIRDDFFWRKCYQHRWKTLYYMSYTYPCYPPRPAAPLTLSCPRRKGKSVTTKKPWLNIYMERHLQEFIENLPTAEYEQENIQANVLDICAAYINQLEINYLQPSMDGNNDHIPLDFILSNLPELRTLRLTYCTKTIGTQFYLGCNTMSRRDANILAKGLAQCHELVNFCFHNTNLQPYQLGLFAHSLDKGCHHLTALSLEHCSLGDEGIRQFLSACNKESFATLKYLDLTNNKISSNGAYILARVIKNLNLEKISLRLNPIGSDGAAAIFGILDCLPMRNVDISGCSITDSITLLFINFLRHNRSLWYIDMSNNDLGMNFGKQLLNSIGSNRYLKALDLRNTGLTLEMCNMIKVILKKNFKNWD